MKSKVVLVLFGLALTGCVAPPKPTYDYQTSNLPKNEAQKIYEIAVKCWSKDFSLFQDRVIVENKVELAGTLITARRAAPDIGYQEPFIRVLVSESDKGAVVTVEEGDYAMGSYEDLTQDVKRWSNGDLTCNET
ncbi:hypothetical protein [Salinimonas chungwhensis]|uniref:hypothetical protein n=1 Tax=Salinimonas chungwhensis TaxID=265425 RepID=UPI00036B7A7F|nr:hypothetical protein [Salinimonas chungwhensis]